MKILLGLFLLFVFMGCNSSQTKNQPVKPATTADSKPTEFQSDRQVTINQTKTFNDLEITIGDIVFKGNRIAIGMKLVNKSKNELRFYPNQKSIVIGKTQLDADMFNSGEEVSGEINSGVERIGSVIFVDKSEALNFKDVNKIELHLGDVFDSKTFKSEEVNWTLELPK